MANLFSVVAVLGYTCILIKVLPEVFSQTACSTDDVLLDWNNIHVHENKEDVESWHLCSNEPPKDAKLWPSLGNGHVATVAHSDAVYMNGLYSGNGTESTRARIPAVMSLNVSKINLQVTRKSYCLHMDSGMYLENYIGDHWDLALKIYAHRTMSRLLVTELIVRANGNHPKLVVSIDVNKGNESNEIDFTADSSGLDNTEYMHGLTKVAETTESGRTPVHVYYSMIPKTVIIAEGISSIVRHTFLMSVGPDKNETKSYYEMGLAMKANGTLESTHTDAWHAVWDAGRVDIRGNSFLAAATYSALYYILSAMPTVEERTWPFVGLSPADLAHNGYNGHIFWDQDTWMFPPVLILNSDLGKTLIDTRLRVLDSAIEYARRTSYQGARFPWEGALSGFDVTPWFSGDLEDHITGDVALAFLQYVMVTQDTHTLLHGNLKRAVFAIADFWISRAVYNKLHDMYEILGFDVTPSKACREYEFHISGDVALAFQQYLLMNRDIQFLTDGRLKKAVFNLADFWVSRTVYNASFDVFEITEVMPPDEYHFPVNNSVYTNYIAQKALRLPAYVCKLTGCVVPPRYEDIASKMKIPFDNNMQYHPEFDGYNTSVEVKQADVILLGWPLDMNMTKQIRRNDLEIYAKVTPGGPAMSWGMFAIGWLELQEYGRANQTFYEQLKNRQDPFNIWTEVADGSGATNFITGMGGFLHSVIFGYAGIRFDEDSLTVNCSPFPQTSSFRLKGIDYIGSSIDVICDDNTTKLTLVRGSNTVYVTLSTTGKTRQLELGKTLCLTRQLLTLTSTSKSFFSNISSKTSTLSLTISSAVTSGKKVSTESSSSCPVEMPIFQTFILSLYMVSAQVLMY